MSTDNGLTYSIVDESFISNKPFLTSHAVSGLSSLGATYYFKLLVMNEVGSSESLPKAIVLAVVPEKPTAAPVQDYSATTKGRIKIIYTALTGEDTGGSAILGYDLWRDDGAEGDY